MRRIWIKLAFETGRLAWESQQVIALRLTKLALGGAAAEREGRLMAAEKIRAFQKAALDLATGSTPRSVVKEFRSKVRKNRRRLMR